MPRLIVTYNTQTWPLAEAFVISRGAKTEANVVVAEIGDGMVVGWGECVPYARYGETIETVSRQIESARQHLARVQVGEVEAARALLPELLPPGAARNALDCALWDYQAKRNATTVANLIGCAAPLPVVTAYTLSLDTAEAMASKARAAAHLPLLKLKLGGVGDDARLRAVRAARPDARIIADANEAWTDDLLAPLLQTALETGVELIEQPLPAGNDAALANRPRGVSVCADESLHTRADLPRLAGHYDAVNIKLDKTGGLTEALALANDARAARLDIMVGCMVATSLAMAPALLLAAHARWIDLDGPLLLAQDRNPGLRVTNGQIAPAPRELWG
ncbi:MAG: N-acetyl-D-Glu racemase DgcA [Hyphomicrobiaceae bacterium]